MTNYNPADRRITMMFLRKRVRPGTDDGAFRYELLKYVKIQDNVDLPGEPVTYFEPISHIIGASGDGVGSGAIISWFPDVAQIEILDAHPSEVTRFE